MKQAVGINLKAARKKAGLTQKDLAALAGLSQNYIAQIECGRRAPSLEVLVMLAESINVKPAELLSGAGIVEELRRLVDIVGLDRLQSELEELSHKS